MRRFRLLALALALLGGCGERGLVGENRGVTAEQIANLSAPKVEVVDRSASVRLVPLKRSDLGDEPFLPGCQFGRNGRMLLAASGSDAIARVEGRPLHLVQSSPVDETGGFFEDRQISISIGRHEEAAGSRLPPGRFGRWPARLTTTNRRTSARSEIDGVWRCGG
jgi:hypothetical protein